MSYESLSTKDLIEKIQHLENEKKETLKQQEELVRFQYYITGYLGPWRWDIKHDVLVLHPVQRDMFIPKRSRKTHSFFYYTQKIHKDDRLKVKQAFNNLLDGSSAIVNVEYRIPFNDGTIHWIFHSSKVLDRDNSNTPTQIIGWLFDITEKKLAEQQLKKEKQILEKDATMDFLTNLLNRRGLHKHMNYYIESSSYNGKITIALFDVDNFKQANDVYGHDYGDQVLLEISTFLKNNTRSTDIVSRFGGDEFLIIFTNTSLESAYHVCERIRKAVQLRYENEQVKVTISGGVKEYYEQDINEIIKAVDYLLYKAKKSGKNKIVKQ